MNDRATVDANDRRIICALQVDGRASASTIAAALGLSERTVTRRMNRLFDEGTVRVVLPKVDSSQAQAVTVLLRLRVLKGRVHDIAAALARRDDIMFVDIMEDGQQIVASSTSASAGRARRLLDGIASASDVIELTSHTGLHLYADPTSWNLGLLTPAERAILGSEQGDRPADGSADDPQLRELLAPNARLPLAELARRTSVPVSTIRRRVERLAAAGLLRTVTIVDRIRLGLDIDANITLTVAPASIDAVGRMLGRAPGIHGAAATTGSPNMFAAYYCADLAALHDFVTSTLGSADIAAAEVSLVASAVKRAGVVLAGIGGS